MFGLTMHEGAAIRIPRIFKPVLTYVTPLFLLVMMIWWTKQDAIPTLLMQGVAESEKGVRTVSRLVMIAILAVQLLMIRYAWARKARKGVA